MTSSKWTFRKSKQIPPLWIKELNAKVINVQMDTSGKFSKKSIIHVTKIFLSNFSAILKLVIVTMSHGTKMSKRASKPWISQYFDCADRQYYFRGRRDGASGYHRGGV